jgi:hypothetical protein
VDFIAADLEKGLQSELVGKRVSVKEKAKASQLVGMPISLVTRIHAELISITNPPPYPLKSKSSAKTTNTRPVHSQCPLFRLMPFYITSAIIQRKVLSRKEVV